MFKFKIGILLWFFFAFQLFGYTQSKSKYILYDTAELVLSNARIVDVVKGVVLEGYSLLISNGKIASIAKSETLKFSNKAVVVDLSGKTILPGLVMLHEHMNYNTGAAVWNFQPVSFPKLFLAAGVTTIRTAGAENPMYDLNLKRQIDARALIGPRMFVTGPMFNDKSGGFLGDLLFPIMMRVVKQLLSGPTKDVHLLKCTPTSALRH